MDHPKQEEPQSAFQRFFFTCFEVIGWLRIVASPLLIGLVLGAILYLSEPTRPRAILASAVMLIGLIIGIRWANKYWKGKGTIWFLSRVSASTEVDALQGTDKGRGDR